MTAIKLADAKTHLSELVDRVVSGEAIEITRRGKPVARLAPIEKSRKRIDLATLQAVTAAMPQQTQSAADLTRSVRDSNRY